jgi:nicotinamidase-related amidase
LLIDVINDLAFDGSGPLVAQAALMAAPLARLKRRATAAGLPTIYINDNFGQWRSDFRRTVAHCTARSSPGHQVSRRLRPTARDYFVLKPKHSGFFDTTLDTLLETLSIRRVILTGIAGNICVLFTANDAYFPGGARKDQDLVLAWQTHVSYALPLRSWLAFNGTWFSGGQTRVDRLLNQDLQRNSRIGATLSVPLSGHQSLKFVYSTGASTRRGSAFTGRTGSAARGLRRKARSAR